MQGQIEREIRLLPQVLACTITDTEVVVLAEPTADAWALDRAVRAIIGRYGLTSQVKIFGGEEPVAVRSGFSRARTGIVIGVVAGAAALGTSALVAGLTVNNEPGQKPRPPAAALPSPSSQASPATPTPTPPAISTPPAEAPARRPVTKLVVIRVAVPTISVVKPPVPSVPPPAQVSPPPVTRPPSIRPPEDDDEDEFERNEQPQHPREHEKEEARHPDREDDEHGSRERSEHRTIEHDD